MQYIDADLEGRILRLQGEDIGRNTVQRMESTAASCFAKWGLKQDGPNFPSDYGLVSPVLTKEGEPAVFKIHQVFELENVVPLLRLWGGHGGARLLNSTPDEWGILMERAVPGTTANDEWTAERDEVLTVQAALMLRRLHTAPIPSCFFEKRSFHSAAIRGQAFARYRENYPNGGPLPETLVRTGEEVFEQLGEGSTILHGDFHHFNLLRHGDGWLTVDPQGVLGPPEMDAGPWITNPWPQWVPDIGPELVNRRLSVFREVLGWDRDLVKAWTLARASICAVWSVEDNEDLGLSLEIFSKLYSIWPP